MKRMLAEQSAHLGYHSLPVSNYLAPTIELALDKDVFPE
jgi:hypothetical protein